MTRQECGLVLALGFAAGLLGGGAAGYLAGVPVQAQEQTAPAPVITAQRFEVVDPEGNRRIVIGPDLISIDTDKERALFGSTGLLFSELIADNTLEASVSAKGLLVMESGKLRLELAMKNGDPGLRLKDQTGRVRAVLGPVELRKHAEALPDHRPLSSLVLFNDDGQPAWAAP